MLAETGSSPRALFMVNRSRLVVGILFTTIVSLGVHVVALQGLQIPIPARSVKSWFPYRLVSDAAFAYALVTLFSYLAAGKPRTQRFRRAIVCLGIVLGLNETLRGWLMNAYCATPFAGSVLFLALMALASSVYYLSAIGIVATGDVRKSRSLEGAVISLATAAALNLFAPQLVAALQSMFSSAIPSLAPLGSWCKLPYGLNIVVPAYITFIEPVIAAICCAAVSCTEICGTLLRRLSTFTVLVLALKGQLFSVPLYLAYADESWPLSIASMGQFTLEAILLAIGAFLTWLWATAESSRTN